MLNASDVVREYPPAEPRMTGRAWRQLDQTTEREIRLIDRDLSMWAGHPKGYAVDDLLDERLYRRPPDAMATGPIVPGGWL